MEIVSDSSYFFNQLYHVLSRPNFFALQHVKQPFLFSLKFFNALLALFEKISVNVFYLLCHLKLYFFLGLCVFQAHGCVAVSNLVLNQLDMRSISH